MKQKTRNTGQALVEFALIATVLLMIIFLIIEAAHILWGWITVQAAAREGIRYAITGQVMDPCAVNSLDKFKHLCEDENGNPTTENLRVSAIISVTHNQLSSLPLDEQSGIFEDPNYYIIEVWGVDLNGQVLPNFAGAPGQPVVVRAIYRVPILTPLFRPFLPSIPVFGQVTENNENFGQLGNQTQSSGLPPVLPPIATPGVTPSPTNTPTSTPTNTPGPSPTASATGTNTPTATPAACPTEFDQPPVGGNTYVFVTGEPGSTVTIIDLTTGDTLGSDIYIDVGGNHNCPGFADFTPPNSLNQPLVAGHVLLAQSSDGSVDTAIVLPGTPTPTVSPTSTATPPATATSTGTPTPTATASGPYIQLLPNCASNSPASFTIIGGNWPTNETVDIYWFVPPSSNQILTSVAAPHSGTFSINVSRPVVNGTTYQVRGTTSSIPLGSVQAPFQVPCPNVPTDTPVPNATDTPSPQDLIIVGPPELASDEPIIGYEPVEFSMVISNTGDIDVNQLFFVDLYLDPTEPITPGALRIPLSESDGYIAISSLAGKASKVVTITAPLGFENTPETHLVYGMVDSVEQVSEDIETNNISASAVFTNVTPGATPTPSVTPGTGVGLVSGIVRVRITDWVPQFRAVVKLVDSSSTVVGTRLTDENGYYEFIGIPSDVYTVVACVEIDNVSFSGSRTGIIPDNPLANVYMLPGPCSA